MIFLVLSILTNAALVFILKAFDKWKVNLFHAIVANYVTAGLTGFFFSKENISIPEILNADWLWMTLVLGFFFISLFYLIGVSSQKNGVAATSVANKMSLVIPVFFAVLIHGETLNAIKISGIILALVAVYLSSVHEGESESKTFSGYLMVGFIFLGSGVLDTLINFSQKTFNLQDKTSLFVSLSFTTAAITGMTILTIQIIQRKKLPQIRSIGGGVFLGIVNYFSIYFLLNALGSMPTHSAVIFPVNNMGVVAVSAIAAYLLFQEKLSKKNIAGIILAVLSIAIIAWG